MENLPDKTCRLYHMNIIYKMNGIPASPRLRFMLDNVCKVSSTNNPVKYELWGALSWNDKKTFIKRYCDDYSNIYK